MSILIKPVITEKATTETEVNGRYTFLVNPKANKIQIKSAIEAAYGVNVVSVSTLIQAPKVKARYTKGGLQVGKTNKVKKAIIELANEQEIDFYGN